MTTYINFKYSTPFKLQYLYIPNYAYVGTSNMKLDDTTIPPLQPHPSISISTSTILPSYLISSNRHASTSS